MICKKLPYSKLSNLTVTDACKVSNMVNLMITSTEKSTYKTRPKFYIHKNVSNKM